MTISDFSRTGRARFKTDWSQYAGTYYSERRGRNSGNCDSISGGECQVKIFALALALAIAGFGQVLDSVAGGKLELRGTIDRPVFVNHSGQDVVYVAAIQEYVGGANGISRWFLGITPETVIHDGSELDLVWSRATRGIAIPEGATTSGGIKSVMLSLVVTLSGQVFGDGTFSLQKIVESQLKRVHDLGEMAADGNWDPINSDLYVYRYWRPASPERRKALVDLFRSLPVKLWRDE